MSFSRFDIERLKKTADIRDFIPGSSQKGRKTVARCPECGADDKLEIKHTSSMDLAKCWKCGFSISGAINAVMHYDNLSFPEAIRKVADRYGIDIKTEEEMLRENISRNEDSLEGSFCLKQLEASGLTVEDVTARVRTKDGKDWQYVPTFRRGGMSYSGDLNFNDDEMIIFYYDLYGDPMKVATRGAAGGRKDYVRVRWSNPLAHLSAKDNKPVKYQSMRGAEARFYFPQRIREAFLNKEHIETLVIQEGEKKAEKACKHGVMSIAIQGIYNIGNQDTGLIRDLQYLAKECSVKNIILLFDSDWNNLSSSINDGGNIDMRPNQFARAAIKFKDYVNTLQNAQVYVDIWFGHLNENEAGEKGIDDLLAGSLRGRETDFLDDMQKTMHTHDGKGVYADFHKISILPDTKIYDFWNLRDRDSFLRIHADRIKGLKRFRFGKVEYVVNEEGKVVKSTSSGIDRDFWRVDWEESKSGKQKKSCKFDLMAALSFLEANGYTRMSSPELGEHNYGFACIQNSIARIIQDFEIRDFIFDFVIKNTKDIDINNFFAEKLGTLLGRDRLERLRRSRVEEYFDQDSQNRYYSNGQLRITADSVEFGPMMDVAWEENVIKRKFRRVPVIEDITRNDRGIFTIKVTKEGNKCEFLKYLLNTSYFWKDKPDGPNLEEYDQHYLHLVNKITALGFLTADYKFHSEDHAIVCMDAKVSEINQACGRSGKSLFGAAVENIVNQAYINGKEATNDDAYMLSSVTPRSRNIFLDDIRPNFDIKKLFSAMTGKMSVNPKTMARFEIEYEKAPRFLITTNYAINEDSDSAKDRMRMVMFSDWYNIGHKPIEDFGHEFFHGWDEEQWTLFDNLMAECVMFFLRSRRNGWGGLGRGVVPPPMQNAEIRHLRQKMGEAFLQWAETYFAEDAPSVNCRKNRVAVYEDFCKAFPGQKQFVTSTNFMQKLKCFCQYAGLHLNPNKRNKEGMTFSEWSKQDSNSVFIGARDSSGGNEFISVVTDEYAKGSAL